MDTPAPNLTDDLAAARQVVAKIYDSEQDANHAGELLRRCGWKVHRVTGERIRPGGVLAYATVLHPDADAMPEPVGDLLVRPRRSPFLRPGDPGEPR